MGILQQLDALEKKKGVLEKQIEELSGQLAIVEDEGCLCETELIMSSGMLLDDVWFFDHFSATGVLTLRAGGKGFLQEEELETEEDDSAVQNFARLREFIRDDRWNHYSHILYPGEEGEFPAVELFVDDGELSIRICNDILGFIKRNHLKVDFTALIKEEKTAKKHLSEIRKILKVFEVKSEVAE